LDQRASQKLSNPPHKAKLSTGCDSSIVYENRIIDHSRLDEGPSSAYVNLARFSAKSHGYNGGKYANYANYTIVSRRAASDVSRAGLRRGSSQRHGGHTLGCVYPLYRGYCAARGTVTRFDYLDDEWQQHQRQVPFPAAGRQGDRPDHW